MHLILVGLLLGMGAAIPIGPVNLEMIRRNLRYGTAYGFFTGVGACLTDLVYVTLLCLGALTLLQYPTVLRITGVVGACVLIWFAIKIFKANPHELPDKMLKPSLLRFAIEGFLITLVNPFTILFWASVSSQVSLMAIANENALLLAGGGVVIGTLGWVTFLNTVLHFTRHRLSLNAIKRLNYTGGFILLGFAAYGLMRAFTL